MMDIAITKMSSKGQVVIPAEMRKGIKAGEKLLIIENDNQLIIKRAKDLDKNLEEDLAFAKRTEKALKKYEAGEFVEMDFDEFLNEVEKW
ncbi:spoVT / AbrB like domain protein [archaeon BMS3Abin16]|nr:spoVT / AbrB like domain protein [archaeon BMS3Abin16]